MKTDDLLEELRKIFITIEVFNLRFSPIEKIVYGFTALILTAFGAAIVAIVIRR